MCAASSRPGPRTDLGDIRTTLLDTAERLFGSSGVDAVSLRAVGRAAGVSSAGVLYHFPSKSMLVAGVIRRRGAEVGPAIRANLASLVGTSRDVAARDVVDAILMPLVGMVNADPTGGLCWLKILTHLAQRTDEVWLELIASEPSLRTLFLDATIEALGNDDSEAIRARLGIAMDSMLTALAGANPDTAYRTLGADGLDANFVEQLARFTAAGMAAE